MSYLASITIAKKKFFFFYYLWVWPASVLTCLNFDLPEGNTQIIKAGDAGKRHVKKNTSAPTEMLYNLAVFQFHKIRETSFVQV